MDNSVRESIELWASRISHQSYPCESEVSKGFVIPTDNRLIPCKRRRLTSPARTASMEQDQEQNDTSSVAPSSISRSVFSDRIKLVPTAPSSKSRSSSPTRKQIASLEKAVPMVRLRPRGEIPTFKAAIDLHTYIQRDFGQGVIPGCLKGKLEEADSNESSLIPSYLYDVSSKDLTAEKLRLWKSVCKIHSMARECEIGNQDENAWMQVAWKVLKVGMREAQASSLEVKSVQSQTIDSACLPRFDGSPSTKKADLAFTFHSKGDKAKSLYTRFEKAYPRLDLSHLTDAYTGRLLVTYALEGKNHIGDQAEAILQLSIFHAAALQKLKSFQGDAADLGRIPPMLGWTMVGHEWRCFITSFAKDENVVVETTLDDSKLSTRSYAAIFRLIDLVRRACTHLEHSVWPQAESSIDNFISRKDYR